ncbi:unnamed protein product [Closterium sp. NIES-65]|nr:unnamed protein product [Closterium sp. NIES-65]
MAPSWNSIVEQIAVVSQQEQQQDDKLRSGQLHNKPVIIPSHECTQHAPNSAPPIGRKPRPAVLLIPEVLPPPASPLPLPPHPHRRPDQLQARAQQQRGGDAQGPPRRARQLKIWDLQPELPPPAPHVRHDCALARACAQQPRNLPPELPPSSQPDAGLLEAPQIAPSLLLESARLACRQRDVGLTDRQIINGRAPGGLTLISSDGACGGGAPGRSGVFSPDGSGLCGAAHCARCDGLSRPKRWPSIGFPVRRFVQLAQQAAQVAQPERQIEGLVAGSSDNVIRPAWQSFPACPADVADSAEPGLFRARTDGFPPPPCAFTSTPAELPLETPRASPRVAEPWGGKAELGGDWRKLPPPGWYRRRDWGIGNARNAIRGVSVRPSSGAVAPLPAPPTAQHAAPTISHAPPTGERAVHSSKSSITRMHSVPTDPEQTVDECAAVEADPRSKTHRATCLPISGEVIQTHVASFWMTVLGQLEFLGEVSSAFLGEAVPGGRNRQARGEEWSGAQAGSSISGLSHSQGSEQSVGATAALAMGGSDGGRLANAAVDGQRGEATAAMRARLLADPPSLPMESSFLLGEVLSAAPPGQGTTAKNRAEPGRPYLRVRTTQTGQMNDVDTCRKGTGHSPASILDSPVPSDDSSCDSRPELAWG